MALTIERRENLEINRAAYYAAKSKPCMDCKLHWHPGAMTLDHRDRDTKHVTVSGRRVQPNKMFSYDPVTYAKMLEDCDAVCMNCHRIREMERDGKLRMPVWAPFQLIRGALIKEPAT